MRNKIKTIEGQGASSVFKRFKPKEQAKAIEGEFSSQSKARNIFKDLVKERMDIINKLHENVDYNNLKFEYVGPTKDEVFMSICILKNFLIK